MSYQFRRTVSLDHNQCGSTDGTNIPILLHSSQTGFPTGDMRTLANGGYVRNTVSSNGITVPADLVFTSDAAGVTLLAWEICAYSATAGTIEIWVRIPTLNHLTSDTVIYMWYSDPAVSTYQCTFTDVWDSQYGAVYHGGDGTTIGLKDSTTNANHLTNHSASAGAGIAGLGSFSVVQASSQYLDAGSGASVDFGGQSYTAEVWVKWTGTPTNGVYPHVLSNVDASGQNGWELIASAPDDPAPNRLFITHYKAGVFTGGLAAGAINTNTINALIHYVMQYNNATGVGHLFINGVIQTTLVTSAANGVGTPTAPMSLGRWVGGGTHYWNGLIDEVRISKGTARNDDYILQSYNNQKAASTFVAYGGASFVVSDTFTFADAILLFEGLAFGDTLTLSDAVATSNGIVVNPSDTLALTDAVSRLGLGLIFSDALSLADAIAFLVPILLSQSDSLTYTDAVTLLMVYLVQKSDSISLTDASIVKVISAVTEGDNLLFADFVQMLQAGLLNVGDALSLSDLISLQRLNANVFTDTFTFADAVLIGLFADLTEHVSDSLVLTDSVRIIRTTDFDSYIRHWLNDVPR